MEKEQIMCYITYAVPQKMLSRLSFKELPFSVQSEPLPPSPPALYPADFVPEWFRAGSFPEDDWED